MKEFSSTGVLLDDLLSHSLKGTKIVSSSPASGQLLVADLCLRQRYPKIILVMNQEKSVSEWTATLESLLFTHSSERAISIFPEIGRWGRDQFIQLDRTLHQRMACLADLCEADKPQLIVTTQTALATPTLPLSNLASVMLKTTVDDEFNIDKTSNELLKNGYKVSDKVSEVGQFSLRGSILDFYAPNQPGPLRIDSFGDKINSIRFFDPISQKSTRSVQQAAIAPTHEFFYMYEKNPQYIQNVYDYLLKNKFPENEIDLINGCLNEGRSFPAIELFSSIARQTYSPLTHLDQAKACLIYEESKKTSCGAHQEKLEHFSSLYQDSVLSGKPSVDPQTFYADDGHDVFCSIELNGFMEAQEKNCVKILEQPAPFLTNKTASWIDALQAMYMDTSFNIFLPTHESIERTKNILERRSIPTKIVGSISPSSFYGSTGTEAVQLTLGSLSGYQHLASLKHYSIGESVFYGSSFMAGSKQRSSRKAKNFISSFSSLEPKDLVIHLSHGLGQYVGLRSLTILGVESDFLQINYNGSDKIYLPVDRLNQLQKYGNKTEGVTPKLDKLGSANWEKRKSKVKKEVKELADKLLKIQALRETSRPTQYAPPSEAYHRFEAMFEYTETPDQQNAIDAILDDFMSPKLMDRLVCGDVGFGKTEIAMRACFRAVENSQQVIVLCPTTVLCFQHYRTFSQRLRPFGVRVSQINRFVKKSAVLSTLQQFQEKKIDVIIGTHRALSADVKAAKLGLVVVDEEQRFGVTHKEKLKEMKANTDMLTLTATPIPRTLHMAMVGLRDMSILATAPVNRRPIKTYISEYDENLIKEAINFEVKRNGQVFLLHNRVSDISAVAASIQSLAPQAGVRFAHGQMSEHQLESVIIDFIEQKFSVLVCTTIIESGIDMPNVNTIIINNADKLGLSQIYQIKGRVGRSDRQSFAYLLTAERKKLSETAIKRLNTIAANQHLGAGFQIASRDLEIRGSGSLLGDKQSGHMKDIGVELYAKMLREAINELKNTVEDVQDDIDPELKLPISITIPANYVPQESERIVLYKKYFGITSYEELDEVAHEVEDRFGPLPPAMQRLALTAKTKFLLKHLYAKSIQWSEQTGALIHFNALPESKIDQLIGIVSKNPKKYRLSPDYKLFICFPRKYGVAHTGQMEILNDIIKALEPFGMSL